MQYILINDIIKNGADKCMVLNSRPENGRYIKVYMNDYANCGRGIIEIKYKDMVLLSHFIFPPRDCDDDYETRLTLGDIRNALKILKMKGVKV